MHIIGGSKLQEILRFNNIYKNFYGVQALKDVSFEVREGEVLALMGENGAGKSTLIKILSGALIPTSGSITLYGKNYECFSPQEAIQLGIAVIYQEFTLVPALTIYENIFLGNKKKTGVWLKKKSMIKGAEEILRQIGMSLDPNMLVRDLSVAQKQIVEIAKAVSKNVRVLVMDEPSATLTIREVEEMFKLVKKLKDSGVSIIYISHRLEEVFDIADRISVLRDGKYIKGLEVNKTDRHELISLMVGHELVEQYPERKVNIREVVLEVKHLSTEDMLNNISFKLHKGEILGLAGLVGAGRTELAKAIFGYDRYSTGKIFVEGEEVRITSPIEAINNGIALIPEERKTEGVFMPLSVAQNITLPSLRSISRLTFINKKKESKIVNDYISKLLIKTPNTEQAIRNLSGGNQQKVVLAKWLATKAKIFIFDEPTRGIDVGAKQEIYKIIKNLSESGLAIIMISSDMIELLGMADRIITMHEGNITGELSREEATQEKILHLVAVE
jgi:ribose transport system ATP-binding protein